jgi:hypothetical protein
MRVYQCAEGACVGNNTCNGNRTGLLCGYCAPGYALELQVCTKCSSSDNVLKTLTTFLIALGVLLVLLILFLTGWREVAVGNYVHRGYDKLIAALSAGIRKMVLLISMKDKAKTDYNQLQKFLNYPVVYKLLAQGVKIAIGLALYSSLSRNKISVYCLTCASCCSLLSGDAKLLRVQNRVASDDSGCIRHSCPIVHPRLF